MIASTNNNSDSVNILLVDDQPAKLLTYEAMLETLGENLIKASSGKEALAHLLKTDITVVLMDVSMPDLDGFELAEIIRGHPRFQKTAIIFVSAVHLTDVDRLKGYESGAVDYLSVPVVPELLRAKVRVFTELYRKTRESEQLTRELERRVAERTAELKESMVKQLELAEQLRDADRRKDEFLALLAHELRNPLAPVRSALSIMQLKEIADPDLIWCRDVIERQAQQLTRLVDDLLDVSRITHRKIKLRVEQLNLTELVSSALETSKPQIDAYHHRLHVVLPDYPVMILGDATRLTQVISNLLNNAAKYQNPHGVVRLSVECDDGVARIRVRDHGIGITSEHLATIFELFSQGERAPDRAQGGLGVGLSLAKNLVELHGGSISASSAGPGLGSEFVVELPCQINVVARASSEDARGAAANGKNGVASPGASRRILVVDDNVDAAESLAVLLRMRGHEVLLAHDGQTALDVTISKQPGVLLLDIGLPGMDGYEVCRRIRQLGFSETQVIALTGYGQERDRRRTREVGFDAHTVKPVEIEEVLKLLASHRKRNHANSAL